MAITADSDINVFDYAVQEDATPINPGNLDGGVGQMTYTIPEYENSERRIETETQLWDTRKGGFDGRISSLDGGEGFLSVTANSALNQLSRWYTVKPFQGTLQNYLNYIKGLVGLDRNIQADSSVSSRTIRAVGYVGNVWEGLKQFLSANGLEIVQDIDRFRVRPNRHSTIVPENVTTENWTLNAQGTAEILRVPWFETKGWEENVEIFPVISDENFQPISVGANEIVEQEVTIDGSIVSVNQPGVLDYVPANQTYNGTNGVYCVAGADGKPIEASRWKASGGWLRVELTDNPSVIKIIVHGGKVEEYAPYRIAATAGASSYYNSLHITGTGFRWKKQEFSMHTGAERSTTEAETAVDLNNPNLFSLDQAYTAALRAARLLNGGEKGISGSAEQWSEPQAFGLPLGARVRHENAFLRVRSQSVTPSDISYELEVDTTMDDFWSETGPLTMSQFKTKYSGFRMMDFGTRPLQ